MHGLVDDALSGEGGVAVQQHRHDLLALLVAPVELLRPHLPLHHRVDGLQVRRVRHHRQSDVLVGGAVQPLDVGAQVVLDVARSLVGRLQARELREDLVERLPADVGEDVEAPPVRHPHDDALHAELGRLVDDGLHGGDHHLDALQAEPLLRLELLLEKSLEAGGARDPGQQHALLVGGELQGAGRL